MSIDFVPVSEDQQVFICRTATVYRCVAPRRTQRFSGAFLAIRRLSDISPVHQGCGRRIGGVAGDLWRPT